MTFYSIKYICTKGEIEEFIGEIVSEKYASETGNRSAFRRFEALGRDAFLDRQVALAAAIERLEVKQLSLFRALEKVEQIKSKLRAERGP